VIAGKRERAVHESDAATRVSRHRDDAQIRRELEVTIDHDLRSRHRIGAMHDAIAAEPRVIRSMIRNVGLQVDYETRRIYAALMSDLHESSAYSQRIDTLQLGFAPYPHDYKDLATWLVVQARSYTGGLYRGVEWAALVRLFKGGAWVEAGVTAQGKPQLMMMFNF